MKRARELIAHDLVKAVHDLIQEEGYDGQRRVRSAYVVQSLARQFRISQKIVKNIFEDHYAEFVESGLYFEAASEGIIRFGRAESRRHILFIDGMWRPSILKLR